MESHELSFPCTTKFFMRAIEAAVVLAQNNTQNNRENDNTLEVGCKASTNARLLCRGVDTDEDKIGLSDRAVYVR